VSSIAEKLAGKRVGVCLASGFFGFFHHAGVLQTLAALGVRPARITGTSAGALVGSMYAAGLDPDQIADELTAIGLADFWDMHFPFTRDGVGLLAGHRFRSRLAQALPVHRFEDCRVPLSVGAVDIDDGRVRHFSAGSLLPAVHASCAVPYLFTPVRVDGRRYWDGGFGEKCPLVPFLGDPRLDAVVISYLPLREARREEAGRGLRSLLPPFSSIFADTPPEERVERDRASVARLREAGIEVLVLAPERVWLGPFSLERGPRALTQGREGARRILESADESLLGAEFLT
jgi:NTE family protein